MEAYCKLHLEIRLETFPDNTYNYIMPCSECLEEAFDDGQHLGEVYEITWPLIKIWLREKWLRWKLNHKRKKQWKTQ